MTYGLKWEEMIDMRKPPIALLMMTLAVLGASCSGSRMTRTYMDAGRAGKPIKNVLIIAIIDDDEIRDIYETHFKEHLNAVGIKATSSAHALPVSVGKKVDEAEIRGLVEQSGSDTVAITHLVGREGREAFSRAGRLSQLYHSGYYRYYTGVWDYVHAPTVHIDHVKLFLETRLYDVKTQSLIWSGESETIDPETVGQAIGQIVSLVMDELEKNGLIKDR
jgi:hypothetical protein